MTTPPIDVPPKQNYTAGVWRFSWYDRLLCLIVIVALFVTTTLYFVIRSTIAEYRNDLERASRDNKKIVESLNWSSWEISQVRIELQKRTGAASRPRPAGEARGEEMQ